MKYLFLLLAFLMNCSLETSAQTVKVGEEFTLRNRQSIKIENADIEIIVNRIGRKWVGEAEQIDFQFSVKNKGKVKNFSAPLPEFIFVGNFEIKVLKTEVFGSEYAKFVVEKNRKKLMSAKNPFCRKTKLPTNSSKNSVGKLMKRLYLQS